MLAAVECIVCISYHSNLASNFAILLCMGQQHMHIAGDLIHPCTLHAAQSLLLVHHSYVQALLDVYSIRKEIGRLTDFKIGMVCMTSVIV